MSPHCDRSYKKKYQMVQRRVLYIWNALDSILCPNSHIEVFHSYPQIHWEVLAWYPKIPHYFQLFTNHFVQHYIMHAAEKTL